MSTATQKTYLTEVVKALKTHWPENRTVNIVCHGHSVPAGYFATPMVDALNAYPHQLYVGLKRRFPFSVVNVIVTARGGEQSESGAERFEEEVVTHRPDVITIDYSLNDRGIGLHRARAAWTKMIEQGLAVGAKILLMTPTPDVTQATGSDEAEKAKLLSHVEQVRTLAAEYSVGLVDSFRVCMAAARAGDLSDILAWSNHPDKRGHARVAEALMRWFPAG